MAQYNRGTTRTATFMSRRKQNTEEFEPHDMNVAVQQQGFGPGLLVGATHSSKKEEANQCWIEILAACVFHSFLLTLTADFPMFPSVQYCTLRSRNRLLGAEIRKNCHNYNFFIKL